MNGLKRKTWFKVTAVIVLHLFVLSQSALALNADDKYQKQKNLQTGEQTESSEINLAQANMVTTGYSGLANQGYISKGINQDKVDFGGVADGLTDCDLSTKVMILKASGANEAEAATALIDHHKAQDIASALDEAGYDTQKINSFLGNIIKNEQGQEQNNLPAAGKQHIISSYDSAADFLKANKPGTITPDQGTANTITISSYDSAADFLKANKPGTITAENISYKSLLDSGLTDTEIVTQLKDQGAAATDILKTATALDRDMVSVAGAMQEAGFSNAEIANAYIAKASGWAVDKTVDVVNCAVQSLAEVLTGASDIGGSLIDLAYEVIVSDIMQTGEVNIQGGQIMSSMNAIKDVASAHGVELLGANGSIADLENISGAAIVHLDNNHWAVVTDINNDNVTVMDNGAEVTMTKAQFQSRWDGNMLIQENTNAVQLTVNQMIQIIGADIGGEDGGSFGAGNDGEGNAVGGDLGGDHGGNGDSSGGGFGEAVGDVIGAIGSAIGSAVGAIGSAIGSAVGAIGSAIGSAVGAIGSAIGSVSGAIGSMASSIAAGFGNMSSAGQLGTVIGTIAGFALGVPGLGLLGGFLGETASNMASGQSFGDSMANALDSSTMGIAGMLGIGDSSAALDGAVASVDAADNNSLYGLSSNISGISSFTNLSNNANARNQISANNSKASGINGFANLSMNTNMGNQSNANEPGNAFTADSYYGLDYFESQKDFNKPIFVNYNGL